ncbi:MAG: PHP domain-containing protein, partial [Propionibacterium sp.]|nr:PHP domain-containing protein [Propionibacterium sp.]
MGFENPPMTWRQLERTLSNTGDQAPDEAPFSWKRGPYQPPEIRRPTGAVPYAELHAHSSFSFLDGASSPAALIEQAERLGLHGMAITDHDGFYGVVRFAEAAEVRS